ncbi:endothelial zinc finger protein induced by tumor necrosis factor alpha-like [Periplaneta americana]|uniref:endothelial zinc finger protein induced by tumor necrosis factor alpha-like n=1 Tax=Periplaneta americana TaxID=6978 RepID=UPI0037E89D65
MVNFKYVGSSNVEQNERCRNNTVMGTVATTESLTELAKVLELFFKGLAECGLLTTYSVQLQGTAVDFAVQVKYQFLLLQFVRSLQDVLTKTPPVPGHELRREAGTQTVEEGQLTPLVFAQAEDQLEWVEDGGKGTTTDIIVTCHPSALAAITGHGFIAAAPSSPPEEGQSPPVSMTESEKPAAYMDSGTETSLENVAVTDLKPFMAGTESLVLETYEQEPTNVMHIVVASAAAEDQSPKSESLFICEVCQKTFRSASSLEAHQSSKHRPRGQCDLCEERFGSVQSLQEHCRTQHGGRGCFHCLACGKRFMTRLSFRRHMDTHGGKKGAVCDMCGKTFSRPDYLQKHYMTHTGHRPFHCTVCPRQFISSSQLKVHQKTHTGVKEHVCNMCNKAFSRGDKLKDHVLRHLNIKRFHCSMCQRDYAEKRDLTKHLKVHAT